MADRRQPDASSGRAVSVILDEGVDALVVEKAFRSGLQPAVRYMDLPDDERATGGWTAAHGWWSDEDAEGLRAVLAAIAEPNDRRVQDAMAGRRDVDAADTAQAARQAELAEIRAEAVRAARAETCMSAGVPRVRVKMPAAERRAQQAKDRAGQQYLGDFTRRSERARR